MKIAKTTLPKESILNNDKYDYVDSFQGTYLDEEDQVTSQDIGKAFFTSAPVWTSRLFEWRNRIVSVFGLKTPQKATNREELLKNFTCEPHERLGLFKVYYRTENELILGEDDKHLNFRISLCKQGLSSIKAEKTLILSTTVVFNNLFGRLYFLPVKPFHSVIVPSMLRGIIRQIENRKS